MQLDMASYVANFQQTILQTIPMYVCIYVYTYIPALVGIDNEDLLKLPFVLLVVGFEATFVFPYSNRQKHIAN